MPLIPLTLDRKPLGALCAAFLTLCTASSAFAQAPESVRLDSPDSPAVAPAPINSRVFGVLPNYRTADGSLPHSPLPASRKFYIGFKDSTDYPIFILGGLFAGISQAEDSNPSFGGGLRGYGKRYASNLGDQMIGNFMSESVYPQYCSLNDPDPFGNIDSARRLTLAWAQVVVAHLPLHAAEVDPVPAGDDPFFKDLPQNRLLQGWPLPRGE